MEEKIYTIILVKVVIKIATKLISFPLEKKIEVNKTTVRPAGEKRNNKRMIAFPASTTVAPYKLRFTFFIFIINAQKNVKPSKQFK